MHAVTLLIVFLELSLVACVKTSPQNHTRQFHDDVPELIAHVPFISMGNELDRNV